MLVLYKLQTIDTRLLIYNNPNSSILQQRYEQVYSVYASLVNVDILHLYWVWLVQMIIILINLNADD